MQFNILLLITLVLHYLLISMKLSLIFMSEGNLHIHRRISAPLPLHHTFLDACVFDTCYTTGLSAAPTPPFVWPSEQYSTAPASALSAQSIRLKAIVT